MSDLRQRAARAGGRPRDAWSEPTIATPARPTACSTLAAPTPRVMQHARQFPTFSQSQGDSSVSSSQGEPTQHQGEGQNVSASLQIDDGTTPTGPLSLLPLTGWKIALLWDSTGRSLAGITGGSHGNLPNESCEQHLAASLESCEQHLAHGFGRANTHGAIPPYPSRIPPSYPINVLPRP